MKSKFVGKKEILLFSYRPETRPFCVGHSGCAEGPPAPSQPQLRVIAVAAYSCFSILKSAKYQIIHLDKSPFHQASKYCNRCVTWLIRESFVL